MRIGHGFDVHVSAGRARGWTLDESSRQRGTVGFRHPRMLVELETTIGPPGLCGLTVEALLARAQLRRRASGITCLAPEIHDHALLLVVNAFKDKLHSPPWSLRDTAAIVDAPGFDVEVFCDRVTISRSRTMTAIVGAHLAPRSPTWAAIVDRLGPSSRMRYAAAYLRIGRSAPDSLRARLLARVGADRPRDRVIAVTEMAVGTLRTWLRDRLPARGAVAARRNA